MRIPLPSLTVGLAVAAAAVAVPSALAAPGASQPTSRAVSQARAEDAVPGAGAAHSRPKQVVIARTELATTRAWLSVRRTSRYEGAVRLHVSLLNNGTWTSAGSLPVSDAFWYVATGPGALCTWSVGESADSGQTSPPVLTTRPITVRLLQSPALGCGQTFHFHVQYGHLAPGQ
ncbi:MAG TPA: hypothetical protein VFL99_03580 [Segeticoccus sp.]|uniref:hypothetical protein n=1 Tax=Segeticoccus sp. TaxID=2706531 RepID=UPI002D7F7777|nr:hypothetical protein [Segeticoccus sp.]HET8599382.1 hypothetical protein [Segeticoccus sp.]